MTGRKRKKQFLDPTYDRGNVSRRTDELWRSQSLLADNNDAHGEDTMQDDRSINIPPDRSPNENENLLEESSPASPAMIAEDNSTASVEMISEDNEGVNSRDSRENEDAAENSSDAGENELEGENSSVCDEDEDEFENNSGSGSTGRSSESSESFHDPDFFQLEDNNRRNNERGAWNDRIMFEASGLKVSDVLFLITAFTSRFLISEKGKDALLDLVKLLAGPEFKNARALNNSSFKSFDSSADLVSYVFYCDTCNVKLIEPVCKKDIPKEITTCNSCEQEYSLSTESSNNFLLIDVEHQLRLLLENPTKQEVLLENIRRIEEKELMNDNLIEDIYDGKLYRETVPTEPDIKHLTYNVNSDGANIFNSSKRSLWPLQIVINELPPSVRFKNIITAALWITSAEPKPPEMKLYLSEFLEKTRRLREHGVTITNYDTGEDIVFKLTPICVCADSVARPIMQNRLQYNGYHLCSWCYIRGFHSGGTVRYSIGEDLILRSNETHLDDVRNSERTQRIINGVKGPCVSSELPTFDCVWGFPYDYLHGTLLGVVRQVWSLWITPGKEYYISPADRKRINKRMEKIKPPLYVHRLVRLLTEKCKWKGSEWRSWLLFYSIACLIGIVKDKYMKPYMLFVRSIFVLLKTKISEAELQQCEVDLCEFVGECEILYGIDVMTFNIHSLLHLTETVRRSGPLWATSNFPFESFIFNLKRKVKGPRGVLQQISRKILQDTQIRNGAHALCDSASCIEFCEKIMDHRQLNTQYEVSEDGVLLIGRREIMRNVHSVNGVHLNMEINVGILYDRCIYVKTPWRSTAYTRAKEHNDTVCQLHSEDVIEINRFLHYDNVTYILGKKYSVSPFSHDGIEINHMFRAIGKSDEIKAYSIENIKSKHVVIQTDLEQYFSLPPNTLEIQ